MWRDWLDEYVDVAEPIPLFETDEHGVVRVKRHGRDDRPVLKRSRRMEDALREAGYRVVADWQGPDDTFEGVIYLVYTLDGSELVPRYIGTTGKYGREGERLNPELGNIRSNRTKLAGWGDGYTYHVGELSAAVLNHHRDDSVERDAPPKDDYQRWADALFVDGTRRLREPVYFWASAWTHDDTGPFYGFDASLETLEYNLVTLAADLYPDAFLNSEAT